MDSIEGLHLIVSLESLSVLFSTLSLTSRRLSQVWQWAFVCSGFQINLTWGDIIRELKRAIWLLALLTCIQWIFYRQHIGNSFSLPQFFIVETSSQQLMTAFHKCWPEGPTIPGWFPLNFISTWKISPFANYV